jgi:hypothetical protein
MSWLHRLFSRAPPISEQIEALNHGVEASISALDQCPEPVRQQAVIEAKRAVDEMLVSLAGRKPNDGLTAYELSVELQYGHC